MAGLIVPALLARLRPLPEPVRNEDRTVEWRAPDTFYNALQRFHAAAFADTKQHQWQGYSKKNQLGHLGKDGIQQLLSFQENYPLLLNHFFESVDVHLIPRAFALNTSRIMLGSGLNPPEPLVTKEQFSFAAALRKFFLDRVRHVTEDDLYIPNSLNLPHAVMRKDGQVIMLLFYRHGLILDRLIHKVPAAHLKVVLEIGAGWGGFPALAKKKLGPRVRYSPDDTHLQLPQDD